MENYPRHKTGRAYARVLEIIGYIVAGLGIVSGVVAMLQIGFIAGLGYIIGAVVTGIGLYVLGEIVLVLFNIEYNTTVLREAAQVNIPPRVNPMHDENRQRGTH